MYGMFPCMRLKIFAMSYTMQLAPWANMRLQLLLPKTSISIASCVKLRLALYTAKHVWNVSMYALQKILQCQYNAACPLGHYEPSTPSTKDLRPYSKLCKADISLKVKHVWNVSLYALQNFLQCQYNAA